MTQTEALKLADDLDSEFAQGRISNHTGRKAAQMLRALAHPEQEPVAYGMWDSMIGCGGRMMYVRLDKGQDGCTVPLYTTPPQRKPLTELQIRKIASSLRIGFTWFEFAQAIEAASTTTVNPSNHVGFEKLSGEFSTAVLEPEQEPVYQIKVYGSQTAWHDAGSSAYDLTSPNERRILYTTPPQRKPLTDDEIDAIDVEITKAGYCQMKFARAIEAAHGIKE